SAPSGRAAASAAAELMARDLAAWSEPGASGRMRLFVTDEGRAALARERAPTPETRFLAQHAVLEKSSVDGVRVLVDAQESPLGWLARRKLVGAAEFEAGERLRRDLDMGAILPRVTANWTSNVASGARGARGGEMTDLALSARQRANQALSAAGPEFSGLLVDVCGFLKGMETIEAERGWPRRSGKVVLTLALGALARHYGIETQARGPARGKGMRHWGADDYRPRIDGS
ncbi:MAG: ATPase, partial [Beijerinckiaceae bacterium]|nr:ATPase [Beijerinckiaceae bacterium]